MSDRAMPLLFLNLGGEMLYVIDQRLYAQKIPEDKGKKIMEDITVNLLSDRFLDEIFKPQDVFSKKAIRTIFEKLAHTSIMRLNENSMDKLFDLMVMAVKYQISLVTKPRDILLVTLNHLDSITPFVAHSPTCSQLIENCYKRLFKVYSNLADYELQFIRHTILNFFVDVRIKVSVFLRDKVQNWDGSFVLFYDGPVAHGSDIPGTIVYYDNASKSQKESKFNPAARYSPPDKEGSYDRYGDRVTKLGLNVYNSSKIVDTIVGAETTVPRNSAKIISDYESMTPDPKAKAQLDLLCKLIGKSSSKSSSTQADFKLNLFNNEEEEFIYNTQVKVDYKPQEERNSKTVVFDASKRNLDERLNKVMGEFSSSSRGKKYDDDDDDDNGGYARGKNQPARNAQNRKSNPKNADDDDDDIISMFDRMNR